VLRPSPGPPASSIPSSFSRLLFSRGSELS
jgi:hypothetical protein